MTSWGPKVMLETGVDLVTPFVARDVHIHVGVKGQIGIIVRVVLRASVGFGSGNGKIGVVV